MCFASTLVRARRTSDGAMEQVHRANERLTHAEDPEATVDGTGRGVDRFADKAVSGLDGQASMGPDPGELGGFGGLRWCLVAAHKAGGLRWRRNATQRSSVDP